LTANFAVTIEQTNSKRAANTHTCFAITHDSIQLSSTGGDAVKTPKQGNKHVHEGLVQTLKPNYNGTTGTNCQLVQQNHGKRGENSNHPTPASKQPTWTLQSRMNQPGTQTLPPIFRTFRPHTTAMRSTVVAAILIAVAASGGWLPCFPFNRGVLYRFRSRQSATAARNRVVVAMFCCVRVGRWLM
jgi:hypothetical protein